MPRQVHKACGRVVAKPTKKQTCVSRTNCFLCGASPVSAKVSLQLCPGCECVAYCSEHHRDMDRLAAHELECGNRYANLT